MDHEHEHDHVHNHRHKRITRKVIVLSAFLAILLMPLAEARSLKRGCESEFSVQGKRDAKKLSEEEPEEDLLTFTLLHVNDIHSHFEEVNVNLGTCKVRLSNRFQPLNLPSVYLKEPTDIYFKEHT